MEIFLAEHHGFCYGVKRAVDLAIASIGDSGTVRTLGPIIHNPQLVERLSNQGIGVVDSLDDIKDGTVIIRSHGVGPEIYRQAEAKHLKIIDATCPHVKKAQQAAYDLAQEGYNVVIVGEKHHPEVKSIVEWAGANTIVVESLAEVQAVPFLSRIGVVAQTTFSDKDFQEIVEVLKTKCDEIKINRTICTATDQRQQAALELAAKVESMLVVGGKNSANTTRLAQICQTKNTRVYHIETAQELKREWFDEGIQAVGITAGASTPDWIIEEVVQKLQEFSQVLDYSVNRLENGSVVQGKVVGMTKDEVFVDIGYKAEGLISLSELAYPVPEKPSDVVSEGQVIDVYVLDADSADGNVRLSKIKADRIVAWDKIKESLKNNLPLEAKVVEVVKGGLAVSVSGLRGFVPASQVDLRFVEDLAPFVGQSLSVIPIEIDQEKQKIVLSRKVLLERQSLEQENEVLSKLTVGQVVKGKVSRLASFGAFVDIGGIDGLVHISDLSWHRVKTPEEIVNVGDEVEVVVLKVEPVAKRISLSLKQIERDPWFDAVNDFSEGMLVTGKVAKTAKFGAFVELKKGVEGLVPLSELAERRVVNAEEVVEVGQKITVKVLNIDKKNKRMALSLIKAEQEKERTEYQPYLENQTTLGATLGDKFKHLFESAD